MTKESRNRRALDIDYKKREINFGKEVVEKCPAASSSEAAAFVVHEDKIDSEAERMQCKFSGADVKAAYVKVLAGMTPSL